MSGYPIQTVSKDFLRIMDIEAFREYCLNKPGVSEEFPFDNQTLVFKVMGKMFALTGLDSEVFTANLKCDPERAIELRERYDGIKPGWHMNKKYWNTVDMESPQISRTLHKELIDHSYDEVVKGLTKKDRDTLKQL
jgi:predicted DNA-binding protein (MmcQ/YjbR family)